MENPSSWRVQVVLICKRRAWIFRQQIKLGAKGREFLGGAGEGGRRLERLETRGLGNRLSKQRDASLESC